MMNSGADSGWKPPVAFLVWAVNHSRPVSLDDLRAALLEIGFECVDSQTSATRRWIHRAWGEADLSSCDEEIAPDQLRAILIGLQLSGAPIT
jgi:hypothetical protein